MSSTVSRRNASIDPTCASTASSSQATWSQAFAAIAAKAKATKPEKIGAIVGDLASVEEMFALKGLMDKLGAKSVDCRQDGVQARSEMGPCVISSSTRRSPALDEADAIMIIGANPRIEAPVFNARIRKRWLKERVA